MIPAYTDVRLSNPFLRPDWRFERVLRLVGRVPTPGRTTKRDDSYIKQARSFVLRWRKGEEAREALLYENPGLYYAYLIYDRLHSDPETRFMLEARLLANQNVNEIAQSLKTMPETVSWYEKLFFNVNPFLENHDWVVKHVLLPSADRFADETEDPEVEGDANSTPLIIRPYLDMSLKFFAYFGGPFVCDFMISGFRRGFEVQDPSGMSDWLNDQWKLTIQRRSAQAAGVFEINRYNVLELFATHARIIETQKDSESSEERRSGFQRHVSSMLSQLPWTVGRRGAEQISQTGAMAGMDSNAAEIDDEELMLIGSGVVPDSAKEVTTLTIDSRVDTEVKDAEPKQK
jgi:hypothetical protein